MDRQSLLLHQVHAAKLATDLSASAVSTWLMWRSRPGAAVLVAHAMAAVGSAVVFRRDLSPLAGTRRGRYVLHHMPAGAMAVRYAGQLVAWRGAYQHRPAVIVAGFLIVVAGWSHGLLPGHRQAS